MGDLNAVDIAQQVHLEILQDGQCMQPGETLMFKEPIACFSYSAWMGYILMIISQLRSSQRKSTGQAGQV